MSFYHRGVDPIEQYRQREHEIKTNFARDGRASDLWHKAKIGILKNKKHVHFQSDDLCKQYYTNFNRRKDVITSKVTPHPVGHGADLWRRARIGVVKTKKETCKDSYSNGNVGCK